jgi:hypothetical protein
MVRKRVSGRPKTKIMRPAAEKTWRADGLEDAKLRTHSVDKIVSKEARTMTSTCSIRKKLQRLKMWQDFQWAGVGTFPQFLTFFVDNIVSKGLALAQSR